VVALPFFIAGLIFIRVFSRHAGHIQTLYAWDLVGAGLGCVVLVPLLPAIGAGGMLFFGCGLALAASGLFSNDRRWLVAAIALGLAVVAVPFLKQNGYYEFKEHLSKRMLKEFRAAGKVEFTRWDPISKIDVIDFDRVKGLAYDGGGQSSEIYQFNGDYDWLRANVQESIGWQFATRGVLLSHYLKHGSGHRVLVIGSAGGQETKAALLYGASHVDAVELVSTVVDLGKHRYADYNGGIYLRPEVNYRSGEGRSFLRASTDRYDVIQIYSNHTSSSIAAGSGAMATTYLQTVEAYLEYFTHLTDSGILHINHHVYPRMIATAAAAWRQLGRSDFRRHVMVTEVTGKVQDNLPTMLIKMTPWTAQELAAIRDYMGDSVRMVENPLDPENSFLADEFYSGGISDALQEQVSYRVTATTDNKPYFNFLRREVHMLEPDPKEFLNYSTASLLNSQLKQGRIPSDVIHLVVTGLASLLFVVVCVLVPMFFSAAGRAHWPHKAATLVYFSCLGAGFIIIELVLIQMFMKLVGYPLYTYSTVVFALLLSAGIGSYASRYLEQGRRWTVPFAGIMLYGLAFVALREPVFGWFLQTPVMLRIMMSALLIAPLGFVMGMPFPMGIAVIRDRVSGTIAWAWGMNGLFTVVGGFLSVVTSIYWGFTQTLLVALGIYVVAFLAFTRLRSPAAA